MNLRNLAILVAMAVLLFPAAAAAQEWGEIREATLNLNVREKPTKTSEHILTLAKGQRVKVDFMQDDGWVAVFNLNETRRDRARAVGYANSKYLKAVKVVHKGGEAPVARPVASSRPTVKSGSGEGEVKVAVAPEPTLAPGKVGVDPGRVPVKITSDRMTYDETGKVVSFVGNVVAVHGELTLWADRLSAYLASRTNKKFSADSVDRIVAEGAVRAQKGKTKGSCGLLTYFVGEQLLKMEKNPLLEDGPNSLTGEVINFHIRDNRSEVVGGKQRVRAIFMTPDNLKVQ